jgi:hypothetical protein
LSVARIFVAALMEIINQVNHQMRCAALAGELKMIVVELMPIKTESKLHRRFPSVFAERQRAVALEAGNQRRDIYKLEWILRMPRCPSNSDCLT